MEKRLEVFDMDKNIISNNINLLDLDFLCRNYGLGIHPKFRTFVHIRRPTKKQILMEEKYRGMEE